MIRKALIIISLLLCFAAKSQNLVRNSNFDAYTTYLDSNKNVVFQPFCWFYDLKDSNHPIYISTDRFLDKSINNNFHPEADKVNNGEKLNYIALTILPKTQKAYTVLDNYLQKDHIYTVKLDIKTLSQSNCISDILIGFFDSLNYDLIKHPNYIRLNLPDTVTLNYLNSNWLTIKTSYKASGKEKVLVLGDGNSNDYKEIINSNRRKFLDMYNGGPYHLKYFIDNVSIIDETISNHSIKRLDSLTIGNSLIIRNIYFDFDKFQILDNSFPLLDSLANYMKTHDRTIIQIIGHTDNAGTQEYNHDLSYNRASEVVKYLISKGVSKEQLSAIGFGSEQPISPNDEEEGRKKNRRIEIKLVEK